MALEEAQHVSTTADCWTSRRLSFIGMAVHWLENDLVRRSACLAVRRMKGSHTYDVIAKVIDSIHVEFGISSKVNCVIIDNGSNFVKAFTFYEKPNKTNDSSTEDKETDEDEAGDSSDEDKRTVYTGIEEILDAHTRMPQPPQELGDLHHSNYNSDSETEEDRIVLPRHHRCTCHSLNLIVTTDVQKITNSSFKKLKRKVDTKLQSG